jgi:putative restriction endonuclease
MGSPSAARHRAAMPFIHLERELWDLRDGAGREIGPGTDESGPQLLKVGAVGLLRITEISPHSISEIPHP